MNECEVSATIDRLITTALEGRDDCLADAESQFCRALGLNRDDTTDWALADFAGALGAAYMQAATSSFWVGYNAGTNGI